MKENMRLLILIAVATLSLAACSVTPDDPPSFTQTVHGDYKAVAGCVFDELDRDNQDMNMVANDMRHRVRIWLDNGVLGPHRLYEVTLIQASRTTTTAEARIQFTISSTFENEIKEALKVCG
jgi:hypothetical protein